jgi:taurine dioxygenase
LTVGNRDHRRILAGIDHAIREPTTMNDTPLTIRPFAAACGAEVDGPDLSKPLDARTVDAIRRAALDHQVLVFRGQQAMDDAALERFASYFGEFGDEPYLEGIPTHPHVAAVVKEASERRTVNFGGSWHSDWSFLERPPSFTLLHARELPPLGGDTMFANQYAAFDFLSEGMQQVLRGLRAVHSARRSYGPAGTFAATHMPTGMRIRTGESALAERVQPLVRRHAETGRAALYVNPVYTLRIDGWSQRESDALLGFLYAHSVQPEFVCRVRWSPGALTLWDNRCVQHIAVNDYDGHRREMHRTTVLGEVPLAA